MEEYGSNERLLAIPRAQLHGPIPRRGGVEVWEVGGDGKAFKRSNFDVTTCRFFVIICVDGDILWKDTASMSNCWPFRGHSCMVLYLGKVGLKFGRWVVM